MKAWITKNALTKGIIETDIERELLGITFFSNDMYFKTSSMGIDWHTSKKGALLRVEEMRQEKIESLKKQIKKLEDMKFE